MSLVNFVEINSETRKTWKSMIQRNITCVKELSKKQQATFTTNHHVVCAICDAECIDLFDQQQHMFEYHTCNNPRFLCNLWPTNFTWQESLEAHRNYTHGEVGENNVIHKNKMLCLIQYFVACFWFAENFLPAQSKLWYNLVFSLDFFYITNYLSS